MPEVVILGKKLGKPLNKRRRVTVELPEFAVRAIHWRVDEANAGDEEGEQVTFNDVVECHHRSHDEAHAIDRAEHPRLHGGYVHVVDGGDLPAGR